MVTWFKNLKVGSKLILGFSTMILIVGVIGYFGYNSAKNINRQLEDIFSVSLPSIDYLLQADRDLQQLLVAERSMIFSKTGSEVFKKMVEDYDGNLKQADERFEKYKSLAATPEEKTIIPKYEKARDEWKAISRKVVDGRKADTRQGRREALDLTLGIANEKFEEMRGYIDQLTELNLGLAGKAHDIALVTSQRTLFILLGVSGIGLLIGIFLMWVINRGVTKPLRVVIEGLTEASDQVASGSNQVSISSQSLAEGSSEQAASIEETSSSLEEMSSMTKQNANNAGQADNLMKEANRVVDQANDSMSELTTSMEEISKASEETSKIIKTIDEIAFQTNLLALNAAVEAARAGEAGAGFAVVADEVRNLAMRAADAARNTADLIEGTVKKVGDGSELVTKTNDAFSQVAESSKKVGELVGEIAAASNEQADGIEQVNKAVTEMDKVVQQNAANAEESASASEEMSAQAEQMKSSVGDLVAMVGKSGKEKEQTATGLVTSELHQPHRVPLHKAENKQLAVLKGKEANPEQVIPMEDDFKDF
jgi:methyl-accepting chemotaxis protein